MIQGEATLGAPVMTQEEAILEVLVVVHIGQEVEAPFTAVATVAGAEGLLWSLLLI